MASGSRKKKGVLHPGLKIAKEGVMTRGRKSQNKNGKEKRNSCGLYNSGCEERGGTPRTFSFEEGRQ